MITRSPKDSNFTRISNNVLRDDTLSNKAKGLLCFMLSCKDDWEFSIEYLTHKCKDKRSSIAAQIKELEDRGYLKREMSRDEHGHVGKVVYHIYEEPLRPQADASPQAEEVEKAEKNPADPKVISMQDYQRQAGIVTPQADASLGVVTHDAPQPGNPIPEKPVSEKPMSEKPMSEKPTSEKPTSEKPMSEKPTSEKPTSENPPLITTRSNELSINQQSKSKTTNFSNDSLPFPLSPPLEPQEQKRPKKKLSYQEQTQKEMEELRRKAIASLDMLDDQSEKYKAIVKEKIDDNSIELQLPDEDSKKIAYDLRDVLIDTVCSNKQFIRVCGEKKPAPVVKSQLLKIDFDQFKWLVSNLKRNATEIRDPYQYMLASLYRLPSTYTTQFQASALAASQGKTQWAYQQPPKKSNANFFYGQGG